MATKQQFKDFLYEIEPSNTTVSRCSTAHNNLRSKLANHETFKEVHIETFLSGSYKRDTAIRPRKKGVDLHRPDVDIIVETNHSETDSPSDIITLIHDVLTDCGYTSLEINRRSVSVTLSDVDMDVVPVIDNPNDDNYLIPDKLESVWIITNPPGHTTWTTQVNMDNGGRFKPLVKLFKWWKRERLFDLKKTKGFILECLVAEHMCSDDIGYEELFITLLESIRDSYSYYVTLGMVPFLEDPAVPGNNVFSAVKPEEFKAFYEQVCVDAKLARQAFEEDDTDKQLDIWRIIFGSVFPPSGVQKSESSSLLRPVVPAAAVVSRGLTFPNEPVKPPNKPAGFA